MGYKEHEAALTDFKQRVTRFELAVQKLLEEYQLDFVWDYGYSSCCNAEPDRLEIHDTRKDISNLSRYQNLDWGT